MIVEGLCYGRICRIGIYDTLIMHYQDLEPTFEWYAQLLFK